MLPCCMQDVMPVNGYMEGGKFVAELNDCHYSIIPAA